MKKLFIGILSVLCLISFCAGLTACAGEKTEEDKMREQGYLISVRYDAGNGGKINNLENRYVLDMFNPSNYTKDASGKIYIKLTEPTKRNKFFLTRENYFNAGWYQKRELVRNEDGKVVDEQGKTLYQEPITEEFYYDEKFEKAAAPAYTYSDPWDFDKPLEYTVNGEVFDMTLYAAWVPYFSFEYYAKNEKGEWAKYGETSFNYKLNLTKTDGDLDVCYLPDWSETIDGEKCGYMEYKYARPSGDPFSFPEKTGYTFKAAYTDENMTQPISSSIKHSGSMDFSTATAMNPVQKIYVEFEEGTRYIIATAKQLYDTANATGIYTIIKDLDFTGVNWSDTFESGTFRGKIDGGNHTIKNVTANHTNSNRLQGGLFGKITKEAEIKDIIFESATLDIKAISFRETQGANIGMFSGNIETGAKVSNVSLVDSTIKIVGYDIKILSSNNIYMCAGGDSRGVTHNGVNLVIYGRESGEEYAYSVGYSGLEDVKTEYVEGTEVKELVNKKIILVAKDEEKKPEPEQKTILEEHK